MPSKKWARVAATDPDAAPDETGEDTQAIGTCVNTDDAAGKRILGERLQPVEDSTTARRRGGKAIVTDAPFAESREWIVGSGILDCSDVDEVLEIAAQHPTAARGRLELRPFWSPADEAAVSERLSGAEHYGADSRNRVDRALTEALAAEWLRIVATLIRTTGDWDLAEDAVADAVERALRRWPRDGVPENPAAWLTTTARRRAIDLIRRADAERCRLAERCALAERSASEELWSPNQPSDIPSVDDDRLRLVFTCCHPALTMETRVALTLKAVYGLSTAAIARAFL